MYIFWAPIFFLYLCTLVLLVLLFLPLLSSLLFYLCHPPLTLFSSLLFRSCKLLPPPSLHLNTFHLLPPLTLFHPSSLIFLHILSLSLHLLAPSYHYSFPLSSSLLTPLFFYPLILHSLPLLSLPLGKHSAFPTPLPLHLLHPPRWLLCT